MSENPKRSQSEEMDRRQAILNANAAKPLSEEHAADLREKLRAEKTHTGYERFKHSIQIAEISTEARDAMNALLAFLSENALNLPDAESVFWQKIPELIKAGEISQNGLQEFSIEFPAIGSFADRSRISQNLNELIISFLAKLGCDLKAKIGSTYLLKGLGHSALELKSNDGRNSFLDYSLRIHKIEDILNEELYNYIQNDRYKLENSLKSASGRQINNLEDNIRNIFNSLGLPENRYEDFKADIVASAERIMLASAEYLMPKIFGEIADFIPVSEPMLEKPLCEPLGLPEKYQGKGKSGEIYAFLERVYSYREGAEPLTTAYLKQHDPKALVAFYNRQRAVAPPQTLSVLTSDGPGTTMVKRLADHNVDISTPEGVAEAKKLASAITKLVYGPK